MQTTHISWWRKAINVPSLPASAPAVPPSVPPTQLPSRLNSPSDPGVCSLPGPRCFTPPVTALLPFLFHLFNCSSLPHHQPLAPPRSPLLLFGHGSHSGPARSWPELPSLFLFCVSIASTAPMFSGLFIITGSCSPGNLHFPSQSPPPTMNC